MESWAQVYTVHPCVVTFTDRTAWWPAWNDVVDGSCMHGRWIWNTVYILCIVHVHDVVTDWSYALVWFLVSTLFCGSPGQSSHCKCFSPFLFQHRSINLRIMTCISGTSRGSTEVEEEKTGLIRYLLECLWTNNSVMSNQYCLICWICELVL